MYYCCLQKNLHHNIVNALKNHVFRIYSFLFQKLWVEFPDAFLVTDMNRCGFSDNRNDTPHSLATKQNMLGVGPNVPIYHLEDGTLTLQPPWTRHRPNLGESVDNFKSTFTFDVAIV